LALALEEQLHHLTEQKLNAGTANMKLLDNMDSMNREDNFNSKDIATIHKEEERLEFRRSRQSAGLY
jgi:hypothetical protein